MWRFWMYVDQNFKTISMQDWNWQRERVMDISKPGSDDDDWSSGFFTWKPELPDMDKKC